MKDIDHHMRPARQINVKAGARKSRGDHITQKAAVAGDGDVIARHRQGMDGALRSEMAFRQAKKHDQGCQRRQSTLDPEQIAPVGHQQHPAPEQGREQGRHRQHQQHLGEDAGCIAGRKYVAHTGARQHRSGAAAGGLDEAGGIEADGTWRQRTGRRTQHIESQTDQQGKPPAEPIGQGSHHRLTHRDAQKIRCQGMFDRGDRNLEFSRDAGQRRQIHVDGDGGESGEGAEQKNKFETAGAGEGRVHADPIRAASSHKQVV